MLLIYSENFSPRLEYIARLIFEDILLSEVSFTSDIPEFQKSEDPKINYSPQNIYGGLYLEPHPLLFSEGLAFSGPAPEFFGESHFLFPAGNGSFLPFDIFAASFYLVSRFEEYQPARRDSFGRFPPEESILYKNGLLQKPLANIWANFMAEKIQEFYPGIVFPERKFRFFSTIDIDHAYAYLHKGFLRSSAAFSKDLLKADFGNLKSRVKTWLGISRDPYDTFGYLDSVFRGNENKVVFFFQLGNYGKYDKNISYRRKAFRELIKNISLKYKTGIHPSFRSSREGEGTQLASETGRLGGITGLHVEASRQHFLKLEFPGTYQRLLNAGITEDYSLGYSTVCGFRAGICTPFYFFDLEKNCTTNLRIFPFQVMDVTLKDFLKLRPGEAINEIGKIMEETRKSGGTFISVWHNENLHDTGAWEGYREVFEWMNQTGFKWANE